MTKATPQNLSLAVLSDTDPNPPHENDRSAAIAALLGRVAGSAGVHMYELEWLSETEYVCSLWIGQALESLLGSVPEGMDEEEAWEACIHPDDKVAYEATFPELQRGVSTDLEYRLVGFDGVTRWVWERCRPRTTADGRLLADGIVTDITARHRMQEELAEAHVRLSHLAYHDPLTELPNRLLFAEHLAVSVERCRRDGGCLAVAFIDLDGFKTVNDRHGHAAGDALLRGVADRLRSVTRESDVIARLGGDEFLMLSPLDAVDHAPRDAAHAITERVRQAIERPLTLVEPRLEITPAASIGVRIFPLDAQEPEHLVREADVAMYQEKTGRRRAA